METSPATSTAATSKTTVQPQLPKSAPENVRYTITSTGKTVLISPFYGYGKHIWAIYPDYWKTAWGRAPLFGYVSADDKFSAKRVAFDVGLVHRNDSFDPKPVRAFLASKPTPGATAKDTEAETND